MSQNDDSEKWRILLVDDDPKFSKSISKIFSTQQNFFLNIIKANNLSGALKELDGLKYHAVLLDLSLPDSPGIESLKEIRKADKYLPVIVLSGKEDNKLISEATVFNIKGALIKSDIKSSILIPMLTIAIENSLKEQESRFQEHRFRDIIENLDDAYYENDLTGTYTYINKAGIKHFGRPREEMIGLNYTKTAPVSLQKTIREEFGKVFRTGKTGKIVENEIIRPDGSILYTEIAASLRRDEKGNPIGFAGISRDVTEKRKAQHALKESEEKYRNILDSIEDGYFEVDLKGNTLFGNHAMLRIAGRDKDGLLNLNNRDYMDEENARKVFDAFNRVYRTGKTDSFLQYEVFLQDGSRVNIESTVSLMKDEKGKPIGFRGLSRDITEKKLAEKALKKSEDRYKNILDSIEDGYFEVDLKGRVTFFNDAALKIIGYDRDTLLSMSYHDYMDKKNAAKAKKIYYNIYNTGKSNRSFQYEIFRGDGTYRFIEASISLIRDAQNTPTGFRAIARDITERKRIETELKKAKKGAEEASLAKSEFLANMSHEIRTPMNGILGMYNLLLSTDLTAEQEDFVDTGKQSADSLLVIINDILDFSKIEAGKMDIEVIDFDIRKSVEEIVTLPAVQAHEKGLEFAYQIGNRVPTLLIGDPGRLRQIIINLCTNAIKFTHNGEVVFRVGIEKENDSHVTLRFSVQDSGIGISKKDQARLFSSFQQVDTSTTRKYGGTGLGLAISKKLVELMGGNINIDSTPGKGSTFWFTIPFEKQTGNGERNFEMAETIRGKRILIVDDNQTNLDILSSYLNYWECASDQALSGQMALSLMRAVAKAGAPYDLVILDMLMPEMDGAELGRIIKADPELENTQMIMLTSQGLRGDAAEVKRIGFSAYLHKPVRRSFLYDCLITVVNQIHLSIDKPRKKDLVTNYSVSEERRHNLKILLAEDNPVNRKLALHLLSKFGFQVDSANDGKEAISALASKEYHVVLMDIQMPEMDGIEATKFIRDPNSNVLNHDIFIIAMTAHAMKGDRNMCLKAGMDDYISKPIKPEVLLKVIEKNIKDFE